MQLRMSCNKLKADVARQQHPEGGLASPDHRVASYWTETRRNGMWLSGFYYLWLGTNEVPSGHSQPRISLACSGAVHLAFV